VTDGDRQELDEIRRLSYMALAARVTERHELVGTLANALIHHQPGLVADDDDVIAELVDVIHRGKGADWVEAVIGAATLRLTD
jgi:hypothetical protein